MSEKKTLIELRDVAKHYKKGGEVVRAVDGINQKIPTTGMVAIVGPSGSGKSTLLHMIGAKHRPNELSGGEMQRVAIARALANDPPLILADEPTGNLDSQAGQMIYELLKEIARERTVAVVTHAEALAQMADRVLHIKDGRLVPGS